MKKFLFAKKGRGPCPRPFQFTFFIIKEKAVFSNGFFPFKCNNKTGSEGSLKKREVEGMKDHEFAKGMGLGVLAGAALGAAMMPRKKHSVKKAAGKAMKTVGQVMENLSEDMGF